MLTSPPLDDELLDEELLEDELLLDEELLEDELLDDELLDDPISGSSSLPLPPPQAARLATINGISIRVNITLIFMLTIIVFITPWSY